MTEIALHICFVGGRGVELTISPGQLDSFYAQLKDLCLELVTVETLLNGSFIFSKKQVESINVFELVDGALPV